MAACERNIKTCKYRPPHLSSHHLWWPSTWYKSALERAFRGHPDNVQHGLCRCLHDLEHLKQPPRKPTITQMREFLQERKL